VSIELARHYEVFRTRHEGRKLPSVEAVKHTHRIGELFYRERIWDPRPRRSIMIAMLLQPDGETYVIPPLDRARVREIRGGTLISGVEIIARSHGSKNVKSDDYPQTWYCRPVWVSGSAFEGDPSPFGNPAEARRRAREHELEESLHAREIGDTLTRQSSRRPTRTTDHPDYRGGQF
jgi:hypothetical protein